MERINYEPGVSQLPEGETGIQILGWQQHRVEPPNRGDGGASRGCQPHVLSWRSRWALRRDAKAVAHHPGLLSCSIKRLLATSRVILGRSSSEVHLTTSDPWDRFIALLQPRTRKAEGIFFLNIILKIIFLKYYIKTTPWDTKLNFTPCYILWRAKYLKNTWQ